MRKYLVFLLLIVCPMLVIADSAGPSVIGYDAVIINKDGLKTVDANDKEYVVPYNTKIHVYDEYDDTALACYIEYADNCYEDANKFSILIKDIAVLKEEIVPADLEKKDNEGTSLEKYDSKVLISDKNGVKLRKGPADAYGYYNQTIPYKTILNFKYGISRSMAGLSWIYIDENGYKGWIEKTYDSDTFCVLSDEKVLTFANITITDDNNKIEIPQETFLEAIYSGYPTSFVEYEKKLGKIDYEKLFVGYKSNLGYIYTTKSIELKSGGKTITAIPKGQKVKILYGYQEGEYGDNPIRNTGAICINEKECYYYVEYNGAKGFVSSDSVISLYYEISETNIDYESDLKMYNYSCYSELNEDNFNFSEYSKKCDTGKTIPANTTVRLYYGSGEVLDKSTNRTYYASFVKYKNDYGIVITEDVAYEPSTNTNEPIHENNDDKNRDRVLTIVVYSLMAAGILSLTTYVTIVLINKKKKTNSKEIKEKKPVNKQKKDK